MNIPQETTDFAVNNGIKYVERQTGVIASGFCGTDAAWELSSDGTLNITGSGALTNAKVASDTAWYNYRHMIRVVNVDAGITNLPDFTFYGCTALETVNFAENSSLTTIGGSALRGSHRADPARRHPDHLRQRVQRLHRSHERLSPRQRFLYGKLRLQWLRQCGSQRRGRQLRRAVGNNQ